MTDFLSALKGTSFFYAADLSSMSELWGKTAHPQIRSLRGQLKTNMLRCEMRVGPFQPQSQLLRVCRQHTTIMSRHSHCSVVLWFRHTDFSTAALSVCPSHLESIRVVSHCIHSLWPSSPLFLLPWRQDITIYLLRTDLVMCELFPSPPVCVLILFMIFPLLPCLAYLAK